MKNMKLKLIAVVETPYGTSMEQCIATKPLVSENDHFAEEEKETAVKQFKKMYGKKYIVCDLYEDWSK